MHLPGLLRQTVAVGAVGASLLSAHSLLNWLLLRKPDTSEVPHPPTVSILIPARDEADRLEPTLWAAMAQGGVSGEVVVLDDGSTDGTGVLARRIAASSEHGDLTVRVLDGNPRPDGWLGKPHACWQLSQHATGEVLVFLDADVRLEEDAVIRAVGVLLDGALDLLSPYPRQVTGSAMERVVQPLLQWSWLTFLPLRLAERTRSTSLTAGNGQFMVCRTAAYHAAGGHQTVKHEVIEDVALARSFKSAGFRVGMADGTQLAHCRMYIGWSELREGYSKSLWAAFGSPRGAVGALSLLALLYLAPPLGLLVGLARRDRGLVRLGALGYGAATIGRAFTASRTGGRVVDAPLHPLSIGTLAALTVRSFDRRRRGLLTWKGRAVT
ncbi:glycosyltransferase [Euzebya tangerina]|uniref:glycosyltransferase n=1 Tax=Euzebya tangerina TaxID=591198 RepID=UPI00196A6D2E|nr:glycosyltransferase [Euzebya tangerina]